ncbi:MAG: DUF6446 family protein [Pseudomonadota bacterium]
MKGRWLIISGAIVLAGFTAVLWWTQTRAYYFNLPETDRITVSDRAILVEQFVGIDAASSPIKLRACMTLDPAGLDGVEPSDAATPLTPPPWFDCFDAKTLTRDLESGDATAYLAASDEFDGSRRFVAVYPDGRAYMWRQLSEEFSR